tara:strand:- start:617 stop:1339 length:723 start_codon:yes stop_codon:yes gene_type:complete
MIRLRYIEPVDSNLYEDSRTNLLEKISSINTKIEVCNISLPNELSGPMLPPVPLYINEIVKEVLKAERDGCDAVIIGCCSDPGLPEAQRAVNIPVVGPLQAAAATVAGRGLRLGILCPDEHAWKTTANWLRSNLRYYGLNHVVGPIKFVPMHSERETENLIGNIDLSAEDVDNIFRKKLYENAVPVAQKMLEEDEAKAVLFGCTLWGGMIHEIKAQVDALCLDPIITAVHFAEFQASLRL